MPLRAALRELPHCRADAETGTLLLGARQVTDDPIQAPLSFVAPNLIEDIGNLFVNSVRS